MLMSIQKSRRVASVNCIQHDSDAEYQKNVFGADEVNLQRLRGGGMHCKADERVNLYIKNISHQSAKH